MGTASMVGAGVFVAFAPAAKEAGSNLSWAICLAGLIAFLNARSMAQLSKAIPKSGGAYAYARELIGPSWGFSAGAAFLIGKVGSVAAISLTISNYLGLGPWVATLPLWAMFAINALGVERTALGAKVLSGITLSFLAAVVALSTTIPSSPVSLPPGDAVSVLTAAAFLFFAFAGYARVATLGAEVENPERNIPRAIGISLTVVFLLYVSLGFELERVLGVALSKTERPIFDLLGTVVPEWAVAVSVVAAIASLGSLLALLAGMGRLGADMAKDGELPGLLSRVNSKNAPWVAELGIVLSASALVLTNSVSFTIGLSSFAVLTYYAIANLAAFRLSKRSSQRLLSLCGLMITLVVAASVPAPSLVLGVSLLMLALGIRWGVTKLRSVS
jgi:APA family basic amino acid/polyamine antiporter